MVPRPTTRALGWNTDGGSEKSETGSRSASTVAAKRFTFAGPTRVLNVNDSFDGLDFFEHLPAYGLLPSEFDAFPVKPAVVETTFLVPALEATRLVARFGLADLEVARFIVAGFGLVAFAVADLGREVAAAAVAGFSLFLSRDSN